MEKKNSKARAVLSIFLGILALAWVYPVVMILINSFKGDKYITTNSAFVLPDATSFAGISNYIEALGSQGFATAFGYSLVITVTSVILILLCTSNNGNICYPYSLVYFDVRVVYYKGKQSSVKGMLRTVCILYGRTFPDAHVHALVNSGQARS